MPKKKKVTVDDLDAAPVIDEEEPLAEDEPEVEALAEGSLEADESHTCDDPAMINHAAFLLEHFRTKCGLQSCEVWICRDEGTVKILARSLSDG